MIETTHSGSAAKASCSVAGCGEVTTGFYRSNGETVVIMVGQPRGKDDIPLCTSHTWALGREILERQSA